MYSSAVYEGPDDTPEQAQMRKMHKLIRLARIRPEHHVLEIGSGWGSFAIELVRQTGCRVTSITVSQQQLELARERARAAGLADRITFELRDYRQVEGRSTASSPSKCWKQSGAGTSAASSPSVTAS